MAADYKALPLLIGLGLDSISVSGSVIPHAKQIIRALNFSEISELANSWLKLKSEKEIHDEVNRFYFEKFGESSKEFYSN
jgi:phosphoenolpyruvate-protein kinase (PTS system EI component)